MRTLDETHDPKRRSWVDSANDSAADFPIQNLPFGIFQRATSPGRAGSPLPAAPRPGVAIGDRILDLDACAREGLFRGLDAALIAAFHAPTLNALMALRPAHWSALRRRVAALLCAKDGRDDQAAVRPHLVPMAEAALGLPAAVGDYTDFYASVFHATNVGRLFRPDAPLLPNYKHVPIGYHGRASSLVVSGTPVRRPNGQTKEDTAPAPLFGPSRALDYELELGFFTGPGNALGEPIPLASAEDHLFGVCLLNDWSARDIQKWEYQPLGPFLAKNFATSLSPWVVTLEALAPFRVPAFARPEGDPTPLPYLAGAENQERGGMGVTLEVFLSTAAMRQQGLAPVRLSRGSSTCLYWTPAQMLAHHASNGCNLRPGDLLGSGTVSGDSKDSRGCLLELTTRGAEPLALPSGESRRFLQDGDEVLFRGYCEREGFARIALGECRGTILPAATL
jgi:fumarylacetoacetase